MWPDHTWFMWSWDRLCLIWPITDGLACSMFLFPQCHSHNPSPRAEPRACSYNILCLRVCGCANGSVFMWLHSNIKMKSNSPTLHACTYNTCVFIFVSICSCQCLGTSVCALIMLQEIVSGWAAIGDQYRPGSSHFTWCVLLAMEWIRGWAKQTTCSPGGLLLAFRLCPLQSVHYISLHIL